MSYILTVRLTDNRIIVNISFSIRKTYYIATMACFENTKFCSVGLLLSLKCKNSTNSESETLVLVSVHNLELQKQKLLIQRTGLNGEDVQTLCEQHEDMFLIKFECNKRICCDPWRRHKSTVRTALRPISVALAVKLNGSGMTVKPGEKLCTTCRKCLREEEDQSTSDSDDNEFTVPEEHRACLDDSMTQLGCSPMKVYI